MGLNRRWDARYAGIYALERVRGDKDPTLVRAAQSRNTKDGLSEIVAGQ
jgi:predicted secreted Zn-dependent protease